MQAYLLTFYYFDSILSPVPSTYPCSTYFTKCLQLYLRYCLYSQCLAWKKSYFESLRFFWGETFFLNDTAYYRINFLLGTGKNKCCGIFKFIICYTWTRKTMFILAKSWKRVCKMSFQNNFVWRESMANSLNFEGKEFELEEKSMAKSSHSSSETFDASANSNTRGTVYWKIFQYMDGGDFPIIVYAWAKN